MLARSEFVITWQCGMKNVQVGGCGVTLGKLQCRYLVQASETEKQSRPLICF